MHQRVFSRVAGVLTIPLIIVACKKLPRGPSSSPMTIAEESARERRMKFIEHLSRINMMAAR